MIRPMTLADLAGVMEIEKVSFTAPWSLKTMQDELANEAAHYLVAEEEGKILGFCGYWQVLDEGHIMNVAVAPDQRQKGIGLRLMQAMLQDGRPRGIIYWTLEVRVGNEHARHLYERTGFTLAGIRPGYYASPREDACIYWREEV